MLKAGLIGKLEEIVGKDNVLTEARDLERYATDATGVTSTAPYVVVLPRDAGEVAAVVGLALEEGLPLVPRGGGTGLRGGAVPLGGGIVVSTERMNKGAEIHREDLYVVAGAGAVAGDLRREVEDRGLFYPIDPASEASSTVGGNVAGASVGMHGIKYGTARNYVLGLELVTPQGKILKVGAKTVKSVAGYDLTRLMVGAQGILGIVTSVTLKVLPMPEGRRVLVFAFPDGPLAAAAAAEIVAEGFNLAALEITDRATVTAARAFIGAGADRSRSGSRAGDLQAGPGYRPGAGLGIDLMPDCDAEVLVEFHGTRSLCEGEASKVREMMGAHFGVKVIGDAGYPQAEGLWKVRGAALAALSASAPTAIVMDLALPHGRMEGMLKEIADISRRYQTRIAVFGHAGAGRLHAAVLYGGAASAAQRAGAGVAGAAEKSDAAKGVAKSAVDGGSERAEAAISEVTSACVNLGGVAVADKGMGLAGMISPGDSLPETGREVLGALKKSVDPKGIMNPGKLLHEG